MSEPSFEPQPHGSNGFGLELEFDVVGHGCAQDEAYGVLDDLKRSASALTAMMFSKG